MISNLVFSISGSSDLINGLMASVWDHHHNYLIKLDLGRNSQHVVHQNGDYDKIIVDIV